MQPIIVRPLPGDPSHASFELVAGERRWRAAKIAGLTRIPAIVRQLDDRQLAEWALIENLQREDLNPLERAVAFHHLQTDFQLSHEQVAERVGIDRSSVTNALRLLQLDPHVQEYVRAGRLSGGQAKALGGVTDAERQRQLADQAVRRDWSVRQVEQAVKALGGGSHVAPAGLDPGAAASSRLSLRESARVRGAHLGDLEEQIARQLQTKVKIRPGRKKGTGSLTIEFHSIDHFDALLGKLGVRAE